VACLLRESKDKMPKVDKKKCIGCGACVSVCPEGFELIEGKAKIKNATAKCIAEAIETCPVQAISK